MTTDLEKPPRDGLHPGTTRAIWRALILELADGGYGELSMERVARRAKVGKAALYRRWHGKEAMVLEMIGSIEIPILAGEDRGDLKADLVDYLTKAARFTRRPLARRLLPEFYAVMNRDDTLGRALRAKLLGPKTSRVNELLERAYRRGEIARVPEPGLTAALVVGPIYWAWLIERSPIDDDTIEKLAGAVAAALLSVGR